MTFNTASELAHFGIGKSELLFLQPDLHTAARYLDLFPSRRQRAEALDVWPEALVSGPFGPLAYIIRNDELDLDATRRDQQLRRLQHRVASRCDTPMLVVVAPGKIEVLPLGPGYAAAPATTVRPNQPGRTFFRELATGSLPVSLLGAPGWYASDWSIAGSIATLVVGAARRLAPVKPEEALLIIARAIMIRLLVTRGLIPPAARPDLLREPFATHDAALRANRWLDSQFEGKLLQSDWLHYGSVLGRVYDYRWTDRRGMIRALSDIFAPSNTAGLNWNDIDFAHVRPIVLAEALDRAVAELKLPLDTRRAIHYTPAVLAQFIVDEAVASSSSPAPTLFVTSRDCGQMLIAALEKLVERKWQIDGRRPSCSEIQRLMETCLRATGEDGWRRQVAAATLSLAALDLAAETFPLSSERFRSPLKSVLSTAPAEHAFDLVVGDHANEVNYGRHALERAMANSAPHGMVALCLGSRAVRAPARRLPPIFRQHLRLTGIVAKIGRRDKPNPVDIVFARNEAPMPESQFWFSLPFDHRHAIVDAPSWIDASRSQPISQTLAEQVPGILAAVPALNVLEAGALVKTWRKLATPSDTTDLDDPHLIDACVRLISESVVGQFVRTALGGSSEASRIVLPRAGLHGISEAVRAEAVQLIAGDVREEERHNALIEQLCGLDATDVAIMVSWLSRTSRNPLSPQQFGHELAKWLEPFWPKGGLYVMPLEEEHGRPAFHVFAVRSYGAESDRGFEWSEVLEHVAAKPVASMGVVSIDGSLAIWAAKERLDSDSAWIAALEVLRSHVGPADGEGLWQDD